MESKAQSSLKFMKRNLNGFNNKSLASTSTPSHHIQSKRASQSAIILQYTCWFRSRLGDKTSIINLWVKRIVIDTDIRACLSKFLWFLGTGIATCSFRVSSVSATLMKLKSYFEIISFNNLLKSLNLVATYCGDCAIRKSQTSSEHIEVIETD